MIIGGYTLDLICDGCEAKTTGYGPTRAAATKEARKKSWTVNHHTGKAWCYACLQKRIKGEPLPVEMREIRRKT